MTGTTAFWVATLIPFLLGLLLLSLAVTAFRRRSAIGGTIQVLLAALSLSLAATLVLVGVGMVGFRALTSEQTAALVAVERTAPQRFTARFTFPDGAERSFELAGDELYVDARILKWHSAASLLGLRTAYQLDRVAGRYTSLDDEQTEPRTVYALAGDAPVDLFGLARRYPFLQPLVDAEYGSATFVPVAEGGRYQVRVSASGLLVRPGP